MAKVRNFHEKLEEDIKRLVVEVHARAQHPGGAERSGRELLKESLEAYAERVVPASPASLRRVEAGPELERGEPPPAVETVPETQAVAPAAGGEDSSTSILPDYAGGGVVPAEVRLEVERLVDLVFDKCLSAGIREAKRHGPFVQDAFHDALVDKLLPELEKRGILK
ncbi:MAG: hypothetical protein V1696_00740 [Candidatus Jorgensenbacteria bacterium]